MAQASRTRTGADRTSRPLNSRRPTAARVRPQRREDDSAEKLQSGTEPAPATLAAPKPAQVTIDGVPYVPAGQSGTGLPKVGLAITTHDRNDLLEKCVSAWRQHTPPGWPILIIDDASAKPVDGADFRFDTNVGVPVAKNKCLELLMARGCGHLFLLDDDILPTVDDWWRPYVESPEPHLAHSWNLTKIGGDDRHVAWHASGGTVLYFTRAVITDVGGMRTDFGPDGQPAWGCEHVNVSDRIHNRGWTTWRYADVAGAEKLFDELDRQRTRNGHQSTATDAQREHNRTAGRELWQSRIETDNEFVEYRTDADVILTCLFTNRQAQLSGRKLRPSVEPLRTLTESITHGRMVCFYDRIENPELTAGTGQPVEFAPADCTINVFFQRWVTYWQWLRDHPEVARVWCVDGTDVTQLRDPFTPIESGKLHVGWEPATQESRWLLDHHPERRVHDFMINNPSLQLLNPGLVGGDRATVMEFCHAMVRYFFDVAIDHAQVWQPRSQAVVGSGDVPAANLVAYTRFAGRLITGSRITTVFKAFEEGDNGYSWWKHK